MNLSYSANSFSGEIELLGDENCLLLRMFWVAVCGLHFLRGSPSLGEDIDYFRGFQSGTCTTRGVLDSNLC